MDARLAGENMIVLKTGPGNASRAALEIDRVGPGEVIGTIAGDDTVFVAVETGDPYRVIQKIFSLFRKQETGV